MAARSVNRNHPLEPRYPVPVVTRVRVTVTGVVQGVGFRPFVYSLATARSLTGWVGNDGKGVFVELEGRESAIDDLIREMQATPPPLAHIDTVTLSEIKPNGDLTFRILDSRQSDGSATFVSPDLDVCDECLSELRDPDDRRFRYPFINCTNCGPRFTITVHTPYDRPYTTMAPFQMCSRCRAEYEDPKSRRFHAQPNACPECGPHLWLEQEGNLIEDNPISAARRLVHEGKVVAVKGVGGFHLACDATSQEAVDLMRSRKRRIEKPFAVMVADLATARIIARVSGEEERLLQSRRRPIVLLESLPDSPIYEGVAPKMTRIGVMLPSTPLHHLLVEPGEIWVMTSGNYSSEPIVKDNDIARAVLSDLADGLLLHDRDILVHCDDSVVRATGNTELPLRRSRGYAPFPIRLEFESRPMLAVGGELKATFCLASGHDAFMSQHIGDMENLETLGAFTKAVDHMQDLFRIKPEVLVVDMHPRYMSGGWAERTAAGREVVRVQHHHAHIASVMTENRFSEQVIGFSFDGTGYGLDGTIWGGEILVGDLGGFERIGFLTTAVLPGGDAAVRRPYRIALSHLDRAGIEWDETLAPVAAAKPEELKVIRHQIRSRLNSVETSSMGRLFDAVASLTGIRQVTSYEGQAAMELESIADMSEPETYTFRIEHSPPFVLDPTPVLDGIVRDLRSGVPPGRISARFHRALALAIAETAGLARNATGLSTVALSGGVFQNATLLEETVPRLEMGGFRVLQHRIVPPNDGGLALGQIALANHRLR